MRRGLSAWLFLSLVLLGIFGPVVAGAASCEDCCGERTNACGKLPAAGFSLCCFHSASTLPEPPPSGLAPIEGSRLAAGDETAGLPPLSRDILHVPRSS